MVLISPKTIRDVLKYGAKEHRLLLYTVFFLVVMGLGLFPVEKVAANSFIGISGGNPLIEFGQVDPAEPPMVITGGTQLLIIAPQDVWTLAIEAKGNLVNTHQPTIQIPASRLAWAIHDGNPPQWSPFLANTPQIVCGPADPTDETGTAIRIDYRFSPSWEDPPLPGQYTTDLYFTLSPNLDPIQSWAYPIPFCPDNERVLTIGYWLPGSGPEQVEVIITDTQGKIITSISDSKMAGAWVTVSWNGQDSQGELVPSGMYYYQVMLLSEQKPIAAGMIEIANHQYAGQSVLYGNVIGADISEGLSGAQVALYAKSRRRVATAVTDKDGAYQLTYLPAGEYYVEASMPGYVATVSDLFQLDGYEAREIQLQLLPNRALDIELQLSTNAVAVGDLLKATLRVTNSGTRELLDTIGEIELPAGFAYIKGLCAAGKVYASQNNKEPATKIRWEVGLLKEGTSTEAEIWILVGLDANRKDRIQARAIGYGVSEAIKTQTVSKMVEVTAGPFVATSPQSGLDSHLLIPLGSDVTLEAKIEPESVSTNPSFPSQPVPLEKHLERNPLVPLAEPLLLSLGKFPAHGLRLRLEGREWAMEGGTWTHSLPQSPLVAKEVPIAGIQGATRIGTMVLRGFYGAPQMWPVFDLYPANNTSGPFALSMDVPQQGSVDVTILSWDPLLDRWQEEAPVLFRVDYARGLITLGRAVSTHNSQGLKQYILVTYAGGNSIKDIVWKEIDLAFDQPQWGISASYLETGVGGQLKLVGLRGRINDEKFQLQGDIQTNLQSEPSPWADLTGLLSSSHKIGRGSSTEKSAWQLVAALEIYPGVRVGGGWGHRGLGYGGFWGVTALDANKKWSLTDDSVHRLVLQIREHLMKKPQSQAIGFEADLTSGWTTSLLIKKEKLSMAKDIEAPLAGGIVEGWEQRLYYQGVGLPQWILAYGRQRTHYSSQEDKNHYGLLQVQGKMEDLNWNAKVSLNQNLSDMATNVDNPIGAVAELGVKYGKGKLQPHIQCRQGIALVGKTDLSQGGFEEWALGIDGDVTENLNLSLVHTNRQGLGKANSESSSISQESASFASSEGVSLTARYALWENWSLRGVGKWSASDQKSSSKSHWQGSLELEGELDGGISLDMGWARTQRSVQAKAGKWIDQLSLGVSQGESSGTYGKKKLHFATSLVDGKMATWEMAGEVLFQTNDIWEIWMHGATKMAQSDFTGSLSTSQGIVRLSRRFKPKLAGFVQMGGWQQMHKKELGSSLGLSYEVVPGLNVTMGYTWPVFQASQGGLLSVNPGLFLQLFAH